jgi:hypothetical protein
MSLILAPDIIERIHQEYKDQFYFVEELLINQSFFHTDEVFISCLLELIHNIN